MIQVFVEALDRCFENVCELDLIFHSDKVLYILDEIVMGGLVLETNLPEIISAIEEQSKLERCAPSFLPIFFAVPSPRWLCSRTVQGRQPVLANLEGDREHSSLTLVLCTPRHLAPPHALSHILYLHTPARWAAGTLRGGESDSPFMLEPPGRVLQATS